MEVSTNDGGTLEYVYSSYAAGGQFYFQYRHFQALSNELATPRLLVCPTDRDRLTAPDFQDFNNLNVSYFVGANADYSLPNSMLAGDRNITNTSFGGQSIVRLDNGYGAYWTGEMHQFKGNILFADARVEQLNTAGLTLAGEGAPPVMDLVNPTLKSSIATAPSATITLNPPPNLPAPPVGIANAGPGSTAGLGAGGRTTKYGSGSRPGYSQMTMAGGASGTGKSNKIVKTIADTNAAPASNAPTPILAEPPSIPARGSRHLPWWFWVWLLLLLLAAEGTRRYYKRLRDERAKRSPWARPTYD
jgi:prepilin-type processing-associated H-X9-DG protein